MAMSAKDREHAGKSRELGISHQQRRGVDAKINRKRFDASALTRALGLMGPKVVKP